MAKLSMKFPKRHGLTLKAEIKLVRMLDKNGHSLDPRQQKLLLQVRDEERDAKRAKASELKRIKRERKEKKQEAAEQRKYSRTNDQLEVEIKDLKVERDHLCEYITNKLYTQRDINVNKIHELEGWSHLKDPAIEAVLKYQNRQKAANAKKKIPYKED